MQIALCIGCGCHDARACVNKATGQPCAWIDVDYTARRGVCTECSSHLARLESGDRSVAASVQLGLTGQQRRQAVDLMLSKWKASGFVPDTAYIASLDRYVAGEIPLRHVDMLAGMHRL